MTSNMICENKTITVIDMNKNTKISYNNGISWYYNKIQYGTISMNYLNGFKKISYDNGVTWHFLNENDKIRELQIYPNPSFGKPIYFDFTANEVLLTLVIFNSDSQIVKKAQFLSVTGFNRFYLETNELMSGIYKIIIYGESVYCSSQFIFVR